MTRGERGGKKAARSKTLPGAKSESLDGQSCEIEGGAKNNGSRRQGAGGLRASSKADKVAGGLRVSSKEDKVREI